MLRRAREALGGEMLVRPVPDRIGIDISLTFHDILFFSFFLHILSWGYGCL